MTEEVTTYPDSLTNREKEIYKTLDVFSHGVYTAKGELVDEKGTNGVQNTETPNLDKIIPALNKAVTDNDKDTNGNFCENLSEHDLLNLQTGAKMYHGKGSPCKIEEEEEDEVEESIRRFLEIPTDVHGITHSYKKIAPCFLWYPDDSRRGTCEEALKYLTRGLHGHGVQLSTDRIDLSSFNVDFPVLILCLPPPQERSNISLGDMSVVLLIIHLNPPLPGQNPAPLADDLYWRRYKNLSIILDLMATEDSFHDTRTNTDSVYRLSEFMLKRA